MNMKRNCTLPALIILALIASASFVARAEDKDKDKDEEQPQFTVGHGWCSPHGASRVPNLSRKYPQGVSCGSQTSRHRHRMPARLPRRRAGARAGWGENRATDRGEGENGRE